MTPAVWTDYTSPVDEQRRRDRLARILRDARRAEREPSTRRSHLVSAAMVAGLLLAISIAGGCEGDTTRNYFTFAPDTTRCQPRHHHHDYLVDGPLVILTDPDGNAVLLDSIPHRTTPDVKVSPPPPPRFARD